MRADVFVRGPGCGDVIDVDALGILDGYAIELGFRHLRPDADVTHDNVAAILDDKRSELFRILLRLDGQQNTVAWRRLAEDGNAAAALLDDQRLLKFNCARNLENAVAGLSRFNAFTEAAGA